MSPPLTAVSVWHYRCFVDFTLHLRPLTLLYGRNGVGKSTLVRLLPMIAGALDPDAPMPLDLDSAANGDARFTELEWKGKRDDEPTGFRIGLHWDDPELAVARWHIDAVRGDTPRVTALVLERADGSILDEIQLTPRGYARRREGKGQPVDVEFTGLRPHSTESALRALDKRLAHLHGRLRWLGTGRRSVERHFDPQRPATRIDEHGKGALHMAAADPDLLASAQSWFRRPPVEQDLRIDAQAGFARPLIRALKAGVFDVELADAGSGLNHVLPLLVATRLAQRDGALLAVEEPESHLHLDAQRSLAEWICEKLTDTTRPLLVLETHAEVIVRAVQLAIAKNPDLEGQVGAYWLERHPDGATRSPLVTFDRWGRPRGSGWPRDAFAEERRLARELLDLRMARADDR